MLGAINLNANAVVNKSEFRHRHCVFDCSELNEDRLTGSLMKAESWTVTLSFGPNTATFTSK